MRNAKTYVPELLCPQPTTEPDQTAFFLRNALALVPRNNLARYIYDCVFDECSGFDQNHLGARFIYAHPIVPSMPLPMNVPFT